MSSPSDASAPRLRPAGMPTFSDSRMTRDVVGPDSRHVGAVADEHDLDLDVLLHQRAVDGAVQLGRAVAHREHDH